MGRAFTYCIFFVSTLAAAQQAATATVPIAQDEAPLPDVRQLLLDVERNELASESSRKDYTYHVHLEQRELDSKGNLKRTDITDSESLTIDGVRINRAVARNGKPLTPEEIQKESERVDKEVARAKERRAKLTAKGEESDTRGDQVITASRILELGTFTNPQRVAFNGRPTIVADYAGDPNAKTRNSSEGVIRDLVGKVWIDESEHVLVHGEGRMLNDFKIGGGLVLDIHKGFHFNFGASKINGEVWLPAVLDAEGSARYLLFGKINGSIHLVTSDYRKFRSTSTIVGSSDALGPDDKPLPQSPPVTPPQP